MPKAAREYMMSAFVWLDYSERERRKMLDVVDLFGEHDTRDELGIGSVRDAFADMLFPGTSTIMTRARYFLLVPWTYQRGVVAWIEQRSIFPSSQQIYAAMFRRRTESGRPALSMQLRIATPTVASAC